MLTAPSHHRRPPRPRAHARGAVARANRRRLCASIQANCRLKCQGVRQRCTGLGSLSNDPIGFAGGDSNLYRYVGNHPTYATDPNGLEEFNGYLSPGYRSSDVIEHIQIAEHQIRYSTSRSEVRRAHQHLAELTAIQSTLLDREAAGVRARYRSIYQEISGANRRQQFDKSTGYLPFIHEGVNYIDGTRENALYVVSGGISDTFGATETDQYTGWAWDGQRYAFATSLVAAELADGAAAVRAFRMARNLPASAVDDGLIYLHSSVRNTPKSVATIASPLTGKPAAIYHGYANLSRRQQGLLDNLAEFGSQSLVRKGAVSMNDLAALTAKTGDEFLMLTLGGRRMVIRGSRQGFHGLVTGEWAEQMAAQGWRLSGHTHPIIRGQTSLGSLMSSEGDRIILGIFGQPRSAIHNARGDFSVFTPLGD